MPAGRTRATGSAVGPPLGSHQDAGEVIGLSQSISWQTLSTSTGFPYCTATRRSQHAEQNMAGDVDRRLGTASRGLRGAGDNHCRTNLRAFADVAGATAFVDADGQFCHRGRLAGRRQAHTRKGNGGECIRHRARSSAHALCAAQWRRAGRRDRCPAETRRYQGHQGLDYENGDGPRRRRYDKPEPHHPAARRRW